MYLEREEERMEEKRNRVFERKQTEGMTGTTEQETSTASTMMPEKPKNSLKIEVHATATHHHKQLDPVVAHAQAHDFSHSQSVSKSITPNELLGIFMSIFYGMYC